MPYTYKTQANATRSEIDVPELNYSFKIITLPKQVVEQCLRTTPRGNYVRKGSRLTTFNDICKMTSMYLSGFKVSEICRILDKTAPIVNKHIKYSTGDVKSREMHKENRVRNMLGKELASVQEYLYD